MRSRRHGSASAGSPGPSPSCRKRWSACPWPADPNRCLACPWPTDAARRDGIVGDVLSAPHTVSIRVDPRRLFHWQCVLIAALLALHLAVGLPALAGHDRLLGARRLFDLRTEANVPTFVSALTLLAAGIAAALLAAAGAEKPRRWVTTWIGLAAVLVFCAVDEAAQI